MKARKSAAVARSDTSTAPREVVNDARNTRKRQRPTCLCARARVCVCLHFLAKHTQRSRHYISEWAAELRHTRLHQHHHRHHHDHVRVEDLARPCVRCLLYLCLQSGAEIGSK